MSQTKLGLCFGVIAFAFGMIGNYLHYIDILMSGICLTAAILCLALAWISVLTDPDRK